ncbi:hypothetical protein LINPERPRIM_LOCUS36594 [Linum perenne]
MNKCGKQSCTTTTSSIRLPDELVIDIFKSFQDPSSIFRFRCLNKSWNRLLSSHRFIHSFLLFNGVDDGGRHMIVMRNPQVGNYNVHGFKNYLYGHWDDEDVDEDDHKLQTQTLAPSDLILWNPTTRETKQLPPFPTLPFVRYRFRFGFDNTLSAPYRMAFKENIGFGFNSTTGDYTVVATVSWNPRQRIWLPNKMSGLSCWIYSLRDDKWTKFRPSSTRSSTSTSTSSNSPSPFLYGYYRQASTHTSNIIYWWKCTPGLYNFRVDKYWIMSFDMSKQSFHLETVSSPEKLISRTSVYTQRKLFVLKRSLLVIYECFGSDIQSKCYQIWTLLNYDKFKSSTDWMRLYIVDPSLIITPALTQHARHGRCIPAFWKDGYYFSVTILGKLNVFNPEDGLIRDLNIRGCRSSFEVQVYTPSTFSFSEFSDIEGAKPKNTGCFPCFNSL